MSAKRARARPRGNVTLLAIDDAVHGSTHVPGCVNNSASVARMTGSAGAEMFYPNPAVPGISDARSRKRMAAWSDGSEPTSK